MESELHGMRDNDGGHTGLIERGPGHVTSHNTGWPMVRPARAELAVTWPGQM